MNTLLLLASLTMGAAGFVQQTRWEYGAVPTSPVSVVQRALATLGQPVDPVRVVGFDEAREIYRRIPGARALTPDLAGTLHAFRVVGGDTIFINRDSVIYRDVDREPTALGLLKLAGILVHEQTHSNDGEYAATRLQADFVRSRQRALPRREWAAARAYLAELEARATALGRGTRKARLARAVRAQSAVTRQALAAFTSADGNPNAAVALAATCPGWSP